VHRLYEPTFACFIGALLLRDTDSSQANESKNNQQNTKGKIVGDGAIGEWKPTPPIA